MSTTAPVTRRQARRSLIFKDASGSGLEHIFHSGCDEWTELEAKWEAGFRWLDSETGTFYRSAPRSEPARTVARSEPVGSDWRLPPRTLGPKDYLALEPERVPVDLITRSGQDAPTLRLGSGAEHA